MNGYLKLCLGIILLMFIFIPVNGSAYSISAWQKDLEAVADMLESKNYAYYSDGGGPSYFSGVLNDSSLAELKEYNNWLNTTSGKKIAKKYKTNNYKAGNYCNIMPVPCSKKNNKKRETSLSACKKCFVADCTKYCMYKSSLGYAKCKKKKSFNKKNKHFRNNFCKDMVNQNKRYSAYANYRNNTANSNSKKMNTKGIVCHNYIKYALQRSGLYSGEDFSVKKSQILMNDCKNLAKTKFQILIPTDVTQTCHTERVNWLNKDSNGKRPTLKALAEKKLVKKGDIISQWDGSGQHSEVYMGGTGNNIKIYGVGSIYQVDENRGGKYGFGSGIKFLIKSKILSTENDKRNNHNNPQVAAIIRIR